MGLGRDISVEVHSREGFLQVEDHIFIFVMGNVTGVTFRAGQIKTVFVGLFYSAIVPTGLIVTAVAMMSLYWVDKYSLLRLWRRPPVRGIIFGGILFSKPR